MRRLSLSALVLLLAVAASGCSPNSFVGHRVDNFTAYYNTFYNARKALDRGEQALVKEDEPIDRNRYLALFSAPGQASSAKDFDDAIKKSADVLREHPTSKWVDDAAMVIGKSYFYKQNYVGAEQKFREIMDGETALEDEARFWLARTLIAGEAFENAMTHLQESLSREDLARRWEARLRLVQGELHVRRGNWESAAEELGAGLKELRDNDLAARAQFLLAQVLERLGRYDEAAEAFEEVLRYKPRYELSFAAQVSAIRVEGRFGDSESALRSLRRMERDDKHYANRGELAYLRGRIYQAMGRVDDAFATYDDLLYFSDANITAIQGRVHYALGELFRDDYGDYLLAAAHFDTARTQIRTGAAAISGAGRTGSRSADDPNAFAPEAVTDASEQAEVFGSFAKVYQKVAHADSLLYLGSLDDEVFADRILEMRQAMAAEMEAQQREAERAQAMRGFQNAALESRNPDQSSPVASTQGSSTAGFLFNKDPLRAQEGRMSFFETWGERPRVPNWRRQSAISAHAATATDGANPDFPGLRDASPETGQQTLPELDYSDVPRDSLNRARLEAERALLRYELANVLFLAMERPDSAAVWYRLVIEEDPHEPVGQRAFYALAEVQRSLGDTLSARRLYEQVLTDYPETDFSDQVRERLGRRTVAERDSVALAEAAYHRAFDLWQQLRYRSALDSMVTVAARFDVPDVTPRALLAAATVFTEWAARDSLDRYAPLPLRVPDSLLIASGLFEVKMPPAPDPVPVGSPAVLPDSLALPLQGPAERADSLAGAPADSLASPGETAPAGLEAVPIDTLHVPVDTLQVEAAQLEDAPVDTTTAAVPVGPQLEPIYLETLYAGVQKHYAGTPYAERARRMLAALEELRPVPEVPADTLALPADSLAAPADTLVALGDDADVAPDSASAPAIDPVTALAEATADTTAASPEDGEVEASPDSTAKGPSPWGLYGADGLDPAAEGWTLVVLTHIEERLAETAARRFREQGFRLVVLPEPVNEKLTRYRVVIGLFETEEDAIAAQQELSRHVPGRIEPLQLNPTKQQ